MTAALIAKLESASEGSQELDCQLWRIFGGWAGVDHPPAVTQSVDAALALAERALPRWGWDFGKPARMGEHGGQPWADCWPPVEDGEVRAFRLGGPRPAPNHTNASTPALAICAALLRASAAEGGGIDGPFTGDHNATCRNWHRRQRGFRADR